MRPVPRFIVKTQVLIVKKWMCIVCGLIYDEAQGWPDDGIAPGTRWEDVPADWMCPECGVGKEDFEMIEMD
jgi:rubredoxin